MVHWLGHKLCDAGFVINLKDREDRLNRVITELELAGIEGVQRFEACVIKDGLFDKYGCTQSHIELAKKQIENSWEYVLYLEDDCIFDLFYDHLINKENIDYNLLVRKIIEEINIHKPDILWLGVRPEDHTQPFSDVFVIPKKTIMSHAYLGSLNYAKFLVENLKYRDSDHFSHMYPIDFFMSQICNPIDHRIVNLDKEKKMSNNNLKVCLTCPMIFNQGSSHSDLTDNFVSYEFWIKGCYNTYVNPKKLNIKTFIK
jgi:GR25 family glycosyltransferase involved in LPS biosynthesis